MTATDVTAAPAGARPPFGGTLAVLRHELRGLLYAPLSYLFMIGFLAGLSVCVFMIADFYSSDEATIHLLLVFLPWVALILVPALAMGMWSGEQNDRSAELMLTLPLDLGSVVLGKFLAGYVVLLIALAFTIAFPATVFYLGEPDPGAMIGGYLGAALTLAVYFAVALFAAAVVRENVGAFVLGLALLFLFLLPGWDVSASLMKTVLPPRVIDLLALYSPNTWLMRMGDGLIEAGGLIYFAIVIAVSLVGTGLVVAARRRGLLTRRSIGRGLVAVLAGLGALAVAVPLVSRVPGAVDLTAEHEFSLHPGTEAILYRLPTGTVATLYWSAHEASVPVTIKTHARRVRNLLETMVERSGGRLSLRVSDPEPDTEAEIRALAQGVRKVPMSSGDHFFLGLTVSHGGRTGSVPYFDLRRDRLMEYDVALALSGLGRKHTPRIGVLSPLLRSAAASGTATVEGLSFLAELKRAYDLAIVPFFKPQIPEGLDALIVIDASILRREMLYAIDQFVMNGGNLIVMMDPYVRFNRGSQSVNPSPSAEINDISDLLLKWGVRYLGDAVVGDAALASPVADNRGERMSFPFWMRVTKDGLSTAHPATANLNEVFMVEPGALAVEAPDRVTPLVTTTDRSGTRPRKGYGGKTPTELALAFKSDGRRRVMAAALRGPFESAFAGSPEGAAASSFRARSQGAPVVFAVADVDWLFDPFSLQKAQVGDRIVVRPLNDNLAFLLNMVGYAGGDPALVRIRSRGRLQRPFTRVAGLFKQAERQFRAEEQKLTARSAEIENRIAETLRSSGAKSLDRLPPTARDEIKAFRKELLPVRRKLREVRLRIRSRVEGLGRRLTVLNLLAGPAATLLFALAVFALRRRRVTRRA